MQHRAGRQQRLVAVRIEIRHVPVEVEVIDRAQDLDRVVGQNRFEGHRLAAHVHVRLEGVDARRFVQAEVAVMPDDGVRGNFELVERTVAEVQRTHFIFRNVALRIKDERHLGPIFELFSDREVVHVETQPAAFLEQAAGVRRERVAVLADGVLVQVDAAFRGAGRCVRLDDIHHHVVHDLPRAGPDLHGLDVAVFGNLDVGEVVDPPIRSFGVHGVFITHGNHQVGLADVPGILRSEFLRRRRVGGIAARGARIHPFHNRRDVGLVERQIVLVVTDAHRLVEMPRRHFTVRDPRLDRARPRPHLFERGQRHRGAGAGVMALRALGLEDWRDVFRVGHLLRGRGRARRCPDRDSGERREP